MSITAPGVWNVSNNRILTQLTAKPPEIPSPSDQGIEAGEGDDESPPNAFKVGKLSSLALYSLTNVGFSSASSQDAVLPSSMAFDIRIEHSSGEHFGMVATITLEFANPHPGESMVIWTKCIKQFINNDRDAEFILVDTSFGDFTNGKWVNITTDIRFAEEAEAVTSAVMESDSGQTVGKAGTQGSLNEMKLGPVGEKGRIQMTYQCDQIYSYTEMSLSEEPGCCDLVPVVVHLPHALLGACCSSCALSVTLQGPPWSSSINLESNILAVKHMNLANGTTPSSAVLVPSPSVPTDSDLATGVRFAWESPVLPPRPACLFFWLSCRPKPFAIAYVEGNEKVYRDIGGNTIEASALRNFTIVDASADVGASKPNSSNAEGGTVMLFQPDAEDDPYLHVPMPGLPGDGSCQAGLYRCVVTPNSIPVPADAVHMHTDLLVSDASGSTRMTTSHGMTRRGEFNSYAERRLLKRLARVPELLCKGIFQARDIWRHAFCIFDNGIKDYWYFECEVGDLDETVVKAVVNAAQDTTGAASERAKLSGRGLQFFEDVIDTITKLRGIRPGGLTSFASAANGAASRYTSEVQAHCSKHANLLKTTFVNWDTDGGNNSGPCFAAVRDLKRNADVVGGFVTGVGAWVDQDCASQVARILRGPCVLNLRFPVGNAADAVLQQDLDCWMKAIKTVPITMTISAGAVSWKARHGIRSENALECLCAVLPDTGEETIGGNVEFALPDVSDIDFTKPVLKNLEATQPVTTYLLSRLPLEKLADSLQVKLSAGHHADVSVVNEPLQGITLAHKWFRVLNGQCRGVLRNKHSLSMRLQQSIEDSLSFNWNMPTPSGSTARLGRSKTSHRPAVPKEKQPSEPNLVFQAAFDEPALPLDFSNSVPPVLAACGPAPTMALSKSLPRPKPKGKAEPKVKAASSRARAAAPTAYPPPADNARASLAPCSQAPKKSPPRRASSTGRRSLTSPRAEATQSPRTEATQIAFGPGTPLQILRSYNGLRCGLSKQGWSIATLRHHVNGSGSLLDKEILRQIYDVVLIWAPLLSVKGLSQEAADLLEDSIEVMTADQLSAYLRLMLEPA